MAEDADRGEPRGEGETSTARPVTEDGSPVTEDGSPVTEDGSPVTEDGGSYTLVGATDDGPTVGVATGDGTPDGDGGGEGVAGPLAPSLPVEPGTPAPENALFVAAGVLLALLVIASGAVTLDAGVLLGFGGAVTVATAGLYAFFRRF